MSNRDKVGRPFLCRSGINSDFMPFMGGQMEIGIKQKKMCSLEKTDIKSIWHKINGIKSGPLLLVVPFWGSYSEPKGNSS